MTIDAQFGIMFAPLILRGFRSFGLQSDINFNSQAISSGSGKCVIMSQVRENTPMSNSVTICYGI